MMNRFPFLFGIVCLSACSALIAANPATAPATRPAVIAAGDKKALDAAMNSDAIVEGTVALAEWSPSGKVFLIHFKDSKATQFQGAMFTKHKEAMEKAFAGDLGKAFTGAKIRIQGKLQTYREHLEILVDRPEQITVIEKAPAHSSHPAGDAQADPEK